MYNGLLEAAQCATVLQRGLYWAGTSQNGAGAQRHSAMSDYGQLDRSDKMVHSERLVRAHLWTSFHTLTPGSCPWEANSPSPNQEIPHLLCNRHVRYRVHNNLPSPLPWTRLIQAPPSCRIPWRYIFIIPYTAQAFQVACCHQVSPRECRISFVSPTCVPHAPPITCSLISSP